MSIQAITGVVGSGKSHEAVKEKICFTLKNEPHRRVITNIEGLDYQAIADFLTLSFDEVSSRLISVSYERVSEPNFWYDPELNVTDTVVQPGDLVIIDEMWRYFNKNLKLPDDAMRFFRMHRHYSSVEHGYTCDVVLINQAMRGIHSDIRDIIEVQYNCRKLKVLGRPQNYQVFVIEGGERNASHNFLRKYDSNIFKLYSSYANKNAKEVVDARQNALAKPFFKIILPFFLIFGIFCSYYVYKSMLHPGKKDSTTALVETSSKTSSSSSPIGENKSLVENKVLDLDEWRVVASYTISGFPVFVLVDSKNRYRTVTASSYSQGASNDVSVSVPAIDKSKATPFTGNFSTFTTTTTQAVK